MNVRSMASALRNIATLMPYDPAQGVKNINMLAARVEQMYEEEKAKEAAVPLQRIQDIGGEINPPILNIHSVPLDDGNMAVELMIEDLTYRAHVDEALVIAAKIVHSAIAARAREPRAMQGADTTRDVLAGFLDGLSVLIYEQGVITPDTDCTTPTIKRGH